MPAHVDARVRVRYAETDQMGVVYHANYLVWMEVGRVEYYRASGARYRDLEKEGILLAVVEAGCRYLSPAFYDDEVVIRTKVEEANPRRVRFFYEITSADDSRRLAEGFTIHVFLGPDRKVRRLPEKYHKLFGIGGNVTDAC
ncbi:MAG TPA: thioesterase family protein [Bryobacteraceae bacterium]|jgi:acyl-CoA thioester hydrolase